LREALCKILVDHKQAKYLSDLGLEEDSQAKGSKSGSAQPASSNAQGTSSAVAKKAKKKAKKERERL